MLRSIRRVDVKGDHNCHYVREKSAPESIRWSFKYTVACQYTAKTESGRKEPVRSNSTFLPYTFDKQNGGLRFNHRVYLVRLINKTTLKLIDTEELGSGAFNLYRYHRIG